MDRRQAVKSLGAMIGASLFLPEMVLARSGEILEGTAPKAKFFSKKQRHLVAEMAETLIPRTDTPGAKDAGVTAWMEVIVKDCYAPDEQQAFLQGLDMIEKECDAKHGHHFKSLSVPEREQFLTGLEKNERANKNGPQFIRKFKDLAKFTYVHSERGATEAFNYVLTPGRHDANMPVTPETKAWAL